MMNGLKPEDLAKFKSIGEAQVSPDGSLVVYTLSVQDKKADKAMTSLWLVPAPRDMNESQMPVGGKPRRLTQSDKDRSPRWSADGKSIAFISERSGRPQIWLIRVDGGESQHIPTEQAVANIAWSPDGKSIAFTSKYFSKADDWVPYPGAPDGDRERAVAQAKQALDGPKSEKSEDGASNGSAKASDVKVITKFNFKADGSGFRGDLRSHVFVVDVSGNGAGKDSDGPSSQTNRPVRRLTAGDYDHDMPAWSPDGKYIVMAALRRDDADYLQKQDLWLAHVESGRLVHLYSGDGPVQYPIFSPDGSKLAFAGHDGSHGPTTQSGLWVLDVRRVISDLEAYMSESSSGPTAPPSPLTKADARCLTASLDRPLGPGSVSDVHYGMGSPFIWENDNSLLFIVGSRGAGSLWRTPADDKSKPSLIWGDASRTIVAFASAGAKHVLQIGSANETEELYAFDEGTSSLINLTDSNPWLAGIALGNVEQFTFKGAGGWDIDGFLTYPVGYDAAKRYPLVLSIHGGPAGAYGPNFQYQCQIMAAKGFAVLQANPRGSSTYSQEFLEAVVGDWGGKDYLDLIAGVDDVIARGVADPDKLFVTGWSYGGYMTSWVVTQTARFKAAVGGAIISDRYSMHSTQDIVLYGEHYFGAAPWDNAETLLSRSPLAYVKNVTTPFMVLHGESDLRCPTGQGDEFYTALKRLGKTAVYVRYPGEYHGFRRLSHRIDRFERTAAWFEYYAERR